jgi:hypothetical protein
MARVAQLGIALGTLGGMLALMGLFPGVTGISQAYGIGILQIFTILTGFALLISGGLIYVKFMFYARCPANLMQQIGIRLALTGLVLAAIAGLADALGFGSHPRLLDIGMDYRLGPWQAVGLIGSYVLAAIGVVIYALSGDPDIPEE